MGFIEFVNKLKSGLAKEIRLFNGASDVGNAEDFPFVAKWYFQAEIGVPRRINVSELRMFAKSDWVQMVTNAIHKQVISCEWRVVAKDESAGVDLGVGAERVETFLRYPNRNGDTFWDVWGSFLRDVLEVDAGVIFKARNKAGELKELYAYDGSTFLISMDEHGLINQYHQYSFKHPTAAPKNFDKDEIVYGKVNNNTENFPYGFSPLQSIQQTVQCLIESTRQNKEFFENNAVPDGIVTVQADGDNLRRVQEYWENSVKGKAHKLVFLNNPVDFKPLRLSNKDMEWLEMQKWYHHIVFGAYGLSPQEVGFYESSNRATSEGQARSSLRNAIKPYLRLIEAKINREIIPEILGSDSVRFEFVLEDDAKSAEKHKELMDKLDRGVLTVNEVRALEGLKPVGWGDVPARQVLASAGQEMQPNKPETVSEQGDESERGKSLYRELFKAHMAKAK